MSATSSAPAVPATLADVAERLRAREPARGPAPTARDDSDRGPAPPRAAVAVILRDGPPGVELLLIKRADHPDDPWSGHIALPGGREEPSDPSLEATAVRETREETGVDLERDGQLLGPLDALSPRATPISVLVQPYVAAIREHRPLVLSDEVAAAFWVPLATLAAPGASTESVVHVRGREMRVQSFRHGDYVVWGLTERIIRQLLNVVAPASRSPSSRP